MAAEPQARNAWAPRLIYQPKWRSTSSSGRRPSRASSPNRPRGGQGFQLSYLLHNDKGFSLSVADPPVLRPGIHGDGCDPPAANGRYYVIAKMSRRREEPLCRLQRRRRRDVLRARRSVQPEGNAGEAPSAIKIGNDYLVYFEAPPTNATGR